MKIDHLDENKIQIQNMLTPFIDMLEQRCRTMVFEVWLKQVNNIELRIIDSPEQYVGKELASGELLERIVHEIFIDLKKKQIRFRNRRAFKD